MKIISKMCRVFKEIEFYKYEIAMLIQNSTSISLGLMKLRFQN